MDYLICRLPYPVILSEAKDLGISILEPRSFVAALLRMTRRGVLLRMTNGGTLTELRSSG